MISRCIPCLPAAIVSTTNLWCISTGKLPEFIVVALVQTDAFIGTPTKSAVNYEHFHLTEAALRVNSDVLQHMIVPYSFANSDVTGVDDFVLGLKNAKAMANYPELGNAISFLTFTKGAYIYLKLCVIHAV